VNIYQKIGAIYQNTRDKLTKDPRNSQATLTGLITLAVRFISVGSGLLSISIAARYLGKEQLGVWLLLSTFMNWVSLADFGITNSLTNILAIAIAQDDRSRSKQAVASAFFPMLGLGIFLLTIAITASFFVHWEEILHLRLSLSLQQDTRLAIAISIYLFTVRIPLSIPRCIYNAYQQGYIYQLWVGLANILSLLSLFISQYYHANLPWLLGAFYGMVIIGDVFAGVYLFYFQQPWLKPRLANCNLNLFRDLIKVGFQFWIAQVCSICIFQTDLIIISQLFGAIEVGIYGVFLKLFSTIEVVSSSFLLPLWPAYSDAKARGDYKWINKTFRGSLIGASIWSISAGILFVALSPILIKYLLDKDVTYSPDLPFYMLLTYILLPISNCISMLASGLGEMKVMSYIAPIAAVSNLILSIVLGKIMGVQGVTLATAICVFVFSISIVGGDLLPKLRHTN
jgi:O-antigen/teichoic acid export membrane protein